MIEIGFVEKTIIENKRRKKRNRKVRISKRIKIAKVPWVGEAQGKEYNTKKAYLIVYIVKVKSVI